MVADLDSIVNKNKYIVINVIEKNGQCVVQNENYDSNNSIKNIKFFKKRKKLGETFIEKKFKIFKSTTIDEFVFFVSKKTKISIEKSIFVPENRVINNFTNLLFKSKKFAIKSIKLDKTTRPKKRLYFFESKNKFKTFENALINKLK